jgi:hypothetical protein
MNTQHTASLSRRFIHNLLLAGGITIITAAVLYNGESIRKSSLANWLFAEEKALTTPALVWSSDSREKLATTEASSPLKSMAEVEMKKFNLIWLYLNNVNRSMELHQRQHSTSRGFLAACSQFDDFIGSLHKMIYATHALDVHNLNAIYPQLGTKFQNFYVKGANLMLSACIEGSEKKFLESRVASDSWFSWYEANNVEIEQSLKVLLK